VGLRAGWWRLVLGHHAGVSGRRTAVCAKDECHHREHIHEGMSPLRDKACRLCQAATSINAGWSHVVAWCISVPVKISADINSNRHLDMEPVDALQALYIEYTDATYKTKKVWPHKPACLQ